jgi:hypothetical protein
MGAPFQCEWHGRDGAIPKIRKAVIGTDGIKSETQTSFPRDEHGDIDLENGKYNEEAKQKLKMKYNDEA